jgi:hypothetical protein
MTARAWLQNRPHQLERLYRATRRLFIRAEPLLRRLGYARADRWLRPVEEPSKRLLFDCRMCGQCVLHSTGMTCPMTCPKNLRNGPCGGVRANGHCEVIPEMRCVWVDAVERAVAMPLYGGEIMRLQPPLDRRLEGHSAWMTMLTGADQACPPGWRLGSVDEGEPALSLPMIGHG